MSVATNMPKQLHAFVAAAEQCGHDLGVGLTFDSEMQSGLEFPMTPLDITTMS